MVSIQMNDIDPQISQLEANLSALGGRMPDMPYFEVLLCRLLLYTGREIAALLEQQIRPWGLAEAEFRVLTTLFSQPDGVAHPGELCTRAAQSPANMSRIADALVDRVLITRVFSAHDRRRVVLRITEQGEELVRELLPKMWVPLRAAMADISDSEQRQLISLLKRVHIGFMEAHAGHRPEVAP